MPSRASDRTPSGSPIAPIAVVSSPGMTFACTPTACNVAPMTTPRKVVLLALAALMLVPATAMAGSSSKSKTTNVNVMTRNLYLGADIISLATASDRNDFEQKAAALFQTVQKTDFNARAALIADEIKKHKPDLIGMQEVALWRKGADGVKDGSQTPATEVVYDWLAILDAELKERKLKYKGVRKQTEFDFEGPT